MSGGDLRFFDKFGQSRLYQLPAGAYLVTGSSAKLHVALSAAVEAASETGKKSAVMVTDWSCITWSGLAPFDPR